MSKDSSNSVWFHTAIQSFQSAHLAQANLICQQILKQDPHHADAFHLLALINQQQGNVDSAIHFIQRSIANRPAEPLFHCNLGLLFRSQGRLEEAISCYRQELLLKPNNPDAYSRLGSALRAQGSLEEASSCFLEAIALQPNFAEAHNNFGNVLQAKGLMNEAIGSYKKALQINPQYAEAYNNLGKVYLDQGRLEEAIISFRQALSIKPDLSLAFANLGKVLLMQGDVDNARAAYLRSEPARLSGSTAVKLALMLPPIMSSKADVMRHRASIQQNLDNLAGRVTLIDPLAEECSTNFYLAFHGENDLTLQKNIAQFYESACPSLLFTAAHCLTRSPLKNKTRIGFLSKFIYTHSVSLSFKKIISKLALNQSFEIILISNHDMQGGNEREIFGEFSGQHVHIPRKLSAAREIIASLSLDILIYLDIGMEPLSYFLAFARLAAVQCVMGGHPVTTGIRNMDYYLSAALAETKEAQSHYSEKLVRLPFGAFYFERPAMPARFKSKKELGLPEHGRIYTCPMTLQKIHPDFDEAVARILQLDPEGYVVFFEDRKYSAWKGLLEKRFSRTIPENLRERILFLPWIVNYFDFICMAKASDVILDPFHFGIGTTAIATCSVGTPFVTRPSEFMRGRVGLFYAKILDVMECVAQDCEDYAQKALAIANNKELRLNIQSKILANNDSLFENEKAIVDVVAWFREIQSQIGAIQKNNVAAEKIIETGLV